MDTLEAIYSKELIYDNKPSPGTPISFTMLVDIRTHEETPVRIAVLLREAAEAPSEDMMAEAAPLLPPKLLRHTSGSFTGSYEVRYLPPIVLNVEFPAKYPDVAPQLQLSCAFLSNKHLSQLLSELDEMCVDYLGTPCVFGMIDFLQTSVFDTLGFEGTPTSSTSSVRLAL